MGLITSNFTDQNAVKTAMVLKLRDSDLTLKDAAQLKLMPYTAQQVASKLARLPVARAGFTIPYFDLGGRPTKFFRFRFLEYHNGNGFAALATANLKHALRYAQPAETVNELYLPPLAPWSKIAQQPDTSLVITEGELKAACACKHLIACIGLGGVWCFKSTRQHMDLLPGFKDFVWKERIVYICYDSDARTNPDVCRAENALARALLALGARPFICRLPALEPDKKTGLDDFIVARGADAFREQVLNTAEEFSEARALWELNEEVLYVEQPGLILRLDNMQRMSPRAFHEHAYAPRVYTVQEVTANGTKLVSKSAAKEWIKWPQRATVTRITYDPALAPRTVTGGLYNMWPGFKVAPQKGDVAYWDALLDYLFKDAPDRDRDWLEQWLAYPLQHPGVKMHSCAVIWGRYQGTGKSLLGYTMFEIYGEANAGEITEQELYNSFNEWAENKQFIMGEEITSTHEARRNVADRLKSIITRRLLRLNPKYIPSYTVPDCINYIFTSNHCDSFFIEDNDRRFFVHEVKGAPLDQEFYDKYNHWLREEGGSAALFHHFLHEVDCSRFNPQAPAPQTESKREMIALSRSDVADWVVQLRDNPDQVLRVAGLANMRKLWTTSELFALYDPDKSKRVSLNGLARELKRAGVVKAWNGGPINTESQGQQRLWILRDVDKLSRLKPAQLAKVFDEERKGNGNAAKF